MKNSSVLKNFSIIILSLSAFSAKAETVYWVGGGTWSDGHTSAWNSAGSWSSGTVPNETSDIIFDKDISLDTPELFLVVIYT